MMAKPSEIICKHFIITRSGAYSNDPLLGSLSELVEDSALKISIN